MDHPGRRPGASAACSAHPSGWAGRGATPGHPPDQVARAASSALTARSGSVAETTGAIPRCDRRSAARSRRQRAWGSRHGSLPGREPCCHHHRGCCSSRLDAGCSNNGTANPRIGCQYTLNASLQSVHSRRQRATGRVPATRGLVGTRSTARGQSLVGRAQLGRALLCASRGSMRRWRTSSWPRAVPATPSALALGCGFMPREIEFGYAHRV